ncbi:hypothetical protein ACFYSC_19455 [Streptosporangium sp. NPDC004379]|uniref:hypothetical protein n=1 Tax=Streptosporangium sp. NPDC004379 TaxID=3366189 RepID=UPI0036B791F5
MDVNPPARLAIRTAAGLAVLAILTLGGCGGSEPSAASGPGTARSSDTSGLEDLPEVLKSPSPEETAQAEPVFAVPESCAKLGFSKIAVRHLKGVRATNHKDYDGTTGGRLSCAYTVMDPTGTTMTLTTLVSESDDVASFGAQPRTPAAGRYYDTPTAKAFGGVADFKDGGTPELSYRLPGVLVTVTGSGDAKPFTQKDLEKLADDVVMTASGGHKPTGS